MVWLWLWGLVGLWGRIGVRERQSGAFALPRSLV